MKRISLLIVLLAGLSPLLSAPPRAAEQPVFRIGTHVSTFGSMDEVADKKGYFAEAFGKGGYNVKVFAQGKLMLEALLANSLDTGFTAARPYVTIIAKHGRVDGIGVNALICKTQSIVVAADSPLRSLKDLRGKKVGTKIGSSENFILTNVLFPSVGIKPGEWTPVNLDNTDRVPSVRAKSVDAAEVEDPTLSLSEVNGWVRRLIPDMCPYDNTPMIQIGNPQTLKAHPELFRKYFEALLKAHRFLRENPDEYARIYTAALNERGAKFEYKVVRKLIDGVTLHPQVDASIVKYLTDMAKDLHAKNEIPRVPDFAKGESFDTKFIDQALKEAGGR
jgi:ABC-type nitrate/sulfonate/bicarbonate transport system substrate-binding protein